MGKRVIVSQKKNRLREREKEEEKKEEEEERKKKEEQDGKKEKEVAVEEKEAKEDGSVVLYRTRTSHVTKPLLRKVMRDDSVVECVTEDVVVEKLIEQEVTQLPEGMTSLEACSEGGRRLEKDLLSVEEFEEQEGDVLVRRKLSRMSVRKPVAEELLQETHVEKPVLLRSSELSKEVMAPTEEVRREETKNKEDGEKVVEGREEEDGEERRKSKEDSTAVSLDDVLHLTPMTRSLIEQDQASSPQSCMEAGGKKYHLPAETEVLGVQEWDEIVEDGRKKMFKVVTKKRSKPVAILDKDKNGVEIERIIGKHKVAIEVDEEVTELEAGVSLSDRGALVDKVTTIEKFEKKNEDGTWIRKNLKRTEIRKSAEKEATTPHQPHPQLQPLQRELQKVANVEAIQPTSKVLRSPNTVLLKQQQQFQLRQQEQGLFPKITEGMRHDYTHPIYGNVTLTSYVEEPGVDEREEEGADGSRLKYRIVTKMHKEKVSVLNGEGGEVVLETNSLGTEIEEYIEEVEKGLSESLDEAGIDKVTSVEESTDEMDGCGWLRRKVVHVRIFRKSDQVSSTVLPEATTAVSADQASVATSDTVAGGQVLEAAVAKYFKTEKVVLEQEKFQEERKMEERVFTLVCDVEEKREVREGEKRNVKIIRKKAPVPVIEKVVGEDGCEKKIMVSEVVEEVETEVVEAGQQSTPQPAQEARVEEYYEQLPDNTWMRKRVVKKAAITRPSSLKTGSAPLDEGTADTRATRGVGSEIGAKDGEKKKNVDEPERRLSELQRSLGALKAVEEGEDKEEVGVRESRVLELNTETQAEVLREKEVMEEMMKAEMREHAIQEERKKVHNTMASNLSVGKQLQQLTGALEALSSVEENEGDSPTPGLSYGSCCW